MANRQTTLVLIGTVFAVAALGAVNMRSSSPQLAQIIEGLRSVQITPNTNLTVEAGGNIRLSAQGDLGTGTMPVQATWYAGFENSERLVPDCSGVITCDVPVGNQAGALRVTAVSGGQRGITSVTVTEQIVNPFSDAVPAWALEAVVRMNRLGIIRGYDDGRFGAGDAVTRGQAITLLGRLLEGQGLLTPCNSVAFADVPAAHFAFGYVCAFRQAQWLRDGDAEIVNNQLGPDITATRATAARFFRRSLEQALTQRNVSQADAASFGDVSQGNPYAEDIRTAARFGLMTGNPNGLFGVNENINRASMAVILYRSWQKLGGGATSAAAGSAASAASAQAAMALCSGRETNLATDSSNCGQCGNICASPAHGYSGCRGGACYLRACDSGWTDSDDNMANGCEAAAAGSNIAMCSGRQVNLITDSSNCGRCGNICASPAHGYSGCRGGACYLRACDSGWTDADGNMANGCERAQ